MSEAEVEPKELDLLTEDIRGKYIELEKGEDARLAKEAFLVRSRERQLSARKGRRLEEVESGREMLAKEQSTMREEEAEIGALNAFIAVSSARSKEYRSFDVAATEWNSELVKRYPGLTAPGIADRVQIVFNQLRQSGRIVPNSGRRVEVEVKV